MRTTVDIPDDIYSMVKQAAEANHVSFRLIVEDALRLYLTRRNRYETAEPAAEWPSIPYAKPMAGMDAKTSSELLEIG